MDKNIVIKPEWLRIHEAIHSGKTQVVIHNVQFEIEKGPSGLKQVRHYPDPVLGLCTFMEQNKDKKSEYARRAAAGETITWMMPHKHDWVLIDVPVKRQEGTL